MGTLVVVADPAPPREPGPNRRYYGYALLAVALLTALCVPNLVGRFIIGVAVAAPPDPPPAVGQCRAPIERPVDLGRLTGAPLIGCARQHSAEIVYVGQLDTSAGYPITADARSLISPAKDCAVRADSFVGTAGTPKPNTVLHVAPQFRTEVTVPIRAQWDAGQHWYSCQVLPAGEDLPVSYSGTVRGAATGPLPAAFGRCAQTINGDPTPCSEPHSAEQISVSQPIPPEHPQLTLDCEGIAAAIIGAPDPSFGGLLSQYSWRTNDSTACWATSTTSLQMVGTLIGWGDKPLPTG